MQYTAIGDAMNVASRLVNLAKPGEIIVSTETYEQVAHQVNATALPPVRVRGKAKELHVYRIDGLRGAAEWATEPTHS